MKKIFTVVGLILALTIPLATFAATSNTPAAQAFRGFCGINSAGLTEKQKTELQNQWQKMQDLKKETINKMVANGSLTKEQGANAIKQIDLRMQYCQENGGAGNCCSGNGRGGGRRGMGRGCGGYGWMDTTTTK